MGLLYPFPVSLEESDFAKLNSNENEKVLTLKSYGLPYLFWAYAFLIIFVILVMFFAIKAPILKLIELGDDLDQTLGYTLLSFILVLPLFIMAFFFYEKRIIASSNFIKLEYRLFGLTIFKEQFEFKSIDQLIVEQHLDSPNMAKIEDLPEKRGFQNKGYFILSLTTLNNNKIMLDRHSRKIDLEQIRSMICSLK